MDQGVVATDAGHISESSINLTRDQQAPEKLSRSILYVVLGIATVRVLLFLFFGPQ